MDVLILSIAAGGGHMRAAQAVRDYMAKHNRNIGMEIVDWFKYINPVVDKVVIGSYMGTLKTSPALYGKLYDMAEKEEGLSDISLTINRLLALRMETLVAKNKPGIVLCTHPFPLEVVCYLKKKKGLDFQIISLLTDFSPHSFWLRDGVDYYIVPNEDLIYEMKWKGVREERIFPFGIPINERFTLQYDKKNVRKTLGLKNKTTLLLMGGSLGMGELKEVFTGLFGSSLDIQLIAVCGNNKKLKDSLEEVVSSSPGRGVIFGYTDEVPRLMAVSDLLITKPGGLTISEAMTMGLPIAIISPIPGQERRNARYLINSGMAVEFKRGDYLEGIISQLMASPVRLSHMREVAALKAKPGAAGDLCRFIASLI
ncbi:MAG: glycosyltransferase [Bacillota bacterium]|nr:glycosyltransferase [Bacillota bacterium]MDD3297408.1 glycosyltransferase [Bacillota bacterium]MDD3851169.1 glycosyltransferase [Bacillota bacterium]MDD4707177.1 glycosyltransferase [Bacillota bacterium]